MLLIIAQTVRLGAPVLGILIPALVFVTSFVVTWLLYRHFSKEI